LLGDPINQVTRLKNVASTSDRTNVVPRNILPASFCELIAWRVADFSYEYGRLLRKVKG
jgi:hypothetical protein